jgi:RNA polymerase sigma factor (sigma-70 family)
MSGHHLGTVVRLARKLAGPAEGHAATDRQLLERFAAHREEWAFAVLVERHGPAVLAVCRHLLDAHDADDAFQATFLVLARKARSVAWHESVGGWLHAVAHRIALKARGDAARRRRRERRFAGVLPIQPAADVLGQELRAALDGELGRLPARYHQPVVLCYLEGQTVEQAARQLLCPAGTVKSRLARARELLRSRLTRRGLALSAAAVAAALGQQHAHAAVPAALADATVRVGTAGVGSPGRWPWRRRR